MATYAQRRRRPSLSRPLGTRVAGAAIASLVTFLGMILLLVGVLPWALTEIGVAAIESSGAVADRSLLAKATQPSSFQVCVAGLLGVSAFFGALFD